MKRILFSCLALVSLQQSIFLLPKDTTSPLAIVIMVKDEEHVIVPTLQPYVDAGVNSFLVFDTGSTDNTIKNAIEFFEKNNITDWHIKEEPFVDFATSRNRGLELAEECFPTIPFFLMPDAEWYMEGVDELIAFCKQEAKKDHNKLPHSYRILIVHPGASWDVQRLIRRASGIRFRGVVHETLIYYTHAKVPESVYFTLKISQEGAEKTKNRLQRDVQLLKKEFDKNPTHARNTFYLAQTYRDLGDLENAYKYYKIRSILPGGDEENFMAMYYLGSVTERLIDQNPDYTWPMALDYYLKAYTLRPTRIEPLMHITRHYLYKEHNPYLAYIFAQRAAQAAYPATDYLFIEKPAYTYERYLLLAKSAWQNGAYETGVWAAEKFLEVIPDSVHMQLLQKQYQNKLESSLNIST